MNANMNFKLKATALLDMIDMINKIGFIVKGVICCNPRFLVKNQVF
jgi:hypothetical protein